MNRKNYLSIILVFTSIILFSYDVFADHKKLLGDYNIYFGNLHAHSKYSDGLGMPEDNFKWARDVAKYDFYALTDHCEYLFPWMWAEIGDLADRYTEDGKFVALRGFEWTNFIAGHINVYDTDTNTSIFSSTDLLLFYSWLGLGNGIGQFNHPAEGNFDNLKYAESVSSRMALIETGNGDNGNNDNVFLPYYIKALDNGWKVAPTNNQDNHKMDTTCQRTAIISKS